MIEAPISVYAEVPVVRPMEEVIEVHGNLEPFMRADLVSEVSGTITELNAEEGDTVSRGEVLARIDDEEYRLNLQQAQSGYRVARSDYYSAKELYNQGMKSKSELDKLRKSFSDAQTNLKMQKIRVGNTEVKSPFDGVVLKRNVELFKLANAMELFFTIADLSEYKIEITVTESEVAKIKVGQLVRIRVDAVSQGDDIFDMAGKVKKVQPMVDPLTGTVEVEVSMPSENPALKTGMFSRLKIVTSVYDSALVVPRKAIVSEANKDYVWIAKGEKAKRVEIKPGLRDEDGVQILSGVDEGDLVVTDGHASLKTDSKIKIIDKSI
jgi:RND family efflux transporter MFP subunit